MKIKAIIDIINNSKLKRIYPETYEMYMPEIIKISKVFSNTIKTQDLCGLDFRCKPFNTFTNKNDFEAWITYSRLGTSKEQIENEISECLELILNSLKKFRSKNQNLEKAQVGRRRKTKRLVIPSFVVTIISICGAISSFMVDALSGGWSSPSLIVFMILSLLSIAFEVVMTVLSASIRNKMYENKDDDNFDIKYEKFIALEQKVNDIEKRLKSSEKEMEAQFKSLSNEMALLRSQNDYLSGVIGLYIDAMRVSLECRNGKEAKSSQRLIRYRDKAEEVVYSAAKLHDDPIRLTKYIQEETRKADEAKTKEEIECEKRRKTEAINNIVKYTFMGSAIACLIAIFVICCTCNVNWVNSYSIATVVLMVVTAILLFFYYVYVEGDYVECSFLLGALGVVGIIIVTIVLACINSTPISSLWKSAINLTWPISWDTANATQALFWLLVGGIVTIAVIIVPIYMAVEEQEPFWISILSTQITIVGIVLVVWISQWFWILVILGIVGSTFLYAMDCNDDIESITASAVFNVAIVVIGYAIGMIIESTFPNLICTSFLTLWG